MSLLHRGKEKGAHWRSAFLCFLCEGGAHLPSI
ncbi:hypothetical protein E2C01_063107 [Portunus trituberculatus]|uniref:Uncharacterized protein n=1 Tax=Portunus trituberculatus TaxID=210409 RepID=A0A5B7HHW0_PORTR|nr:hypothetical protein [Portunus trituberculatus]